MKELILGSMVLCSVGAGEVRAADRRIAGSENMSPSGAPSICQTAKSITSSKMVLRCLLEQHPDVLKARFSALQAEAAIDVAAQRPNPELESRIVKQGGSNGDGGIATEWVLQQPLELGGKRDARRIKGAAEGLSARAEGLLAREQVAISGVLDLHRLRQAFFEKNLLDDALASYQRVIKQYKSRPRLDPEKDVSLSLFRMVESESALKLASLDSRVRQIVRRLEFGLGIQIEDPKLVAAELPRKWPELSDTQAELSSPEYLKGKAELTSAESEFRLAKATAWPDLRLGPLFSTQPSATGTDTSWGVVFSLPLPIINTNEGGKRYAGLGVERLKLNLRTIEERSKIELTNLLDQYRSSIEALKKVGSMDQVDKEHRKVERLFGTGFLAPSLLIESHRQLLESLTARHEQELSAIEAMWRIYALEGRLSEEQL